jgi:hypothetical protein
LSDHLPAADWIPPPDPVIDAYKADVDRTLLRENLRRSLDERFANLIALRGFVAELHRAGAALRASR